MPDGIDGTTTPWPIYSSPLSCRSTDRRGYIHCLAEKPPRRSTHPPLASIACGLCSSPVPQMAEARPCWRWALVAAVASLCCSAAAGRWAASLNHASSRSCDAWLQS